MLPYRDDTLISLILHFQEHTARSHLVSVQQSRLGIFPEHFLVLGRKPEAHDECEDDDSADETSIGRHGDEVSRTVRCGVEVRRKDERRHGDTVHDRQSTGLLLGCLTAGC